MRLRNSKQHVYEFIKRYVAANHQSPTIAEIMRRFEFRSPAAVHEIFAKLESDGLITKVPNVARGVRIVEHPINPS